MGSVSVWSSCETVSDYTLRQWFQNTQQSLFLAACRRLEKMACRPFLTQIFHAWCCETCKAINNSFERTNVTFWGSKRTRTPPTGFQGIKTISPRIYTPDYCNATNVRNAVALERVSPSISLVWGSGTFCTNFRGQRTTFPCVLPPL